MYNTERRGFTELEAGELSKFESLNSNIELFDKAVDRWGTASWNENVLQVTSEIASQELYTGLSVSFMLATTNPESATIKLDGLDVKELLTSTGESMTAGVLTAGQIYTVTYDGTAFRISNVAHATSADTAKSSDEATHATNADSATTATSADNATHAANADSATTAANADMAANYTADGGIAAEFDNLSNSISNLAGSGRTTETVKDNADNISSLQVSLDNLARTSLPASSYTAADVLAKVETVDGTGSDLDADMVDGNHATDFATAEQGAKADAALPADSYTAEDILTKLKTVDGYNSGLDADTLDGLDSAAFASIADLTFQKAGGTATVITLTMATLADGYAKTFIAAANNSGTATTINGKPLYKPNTTVAPNLVAGKAYTVWYNAVGDCFFVKASAEGTAGAADVLAGKTFSNDDDTDIMGLMPDNGAQIVTPGTANISIPKGYHDGTGYVKGDASLLPENIISGKSIFGIVGSAISHNFYTANVNYICSALPNGHTASYDFSITGLSFTPRTVILIAMVGNTGLTAPVVNVLSVGDLNNTSITCASMYTGSISNVVFKNGACTGTLSVYNSSTGLYNGVVNVSRVILL